MEKVKCQICNGLGFKDGKICVCITQKDDQIKNDEFVKHFFDSLFENSKSKN